MTVPSTKARTPGAVAALAAVASGAVLLLVSACSGAAGAGGEATGTPPATASTSVEVAGPAMHVAVTGAIATGLNTPWGLGFLPDGTALVTERDTGTIVSIEPDRAQRAVGTVAGVVPGGEGGLLGLAVSPHWGADHTLYVYLTGRADNRVEAITLAPSTEGREWSIDSQKPILTGIPKAAVHNGGRITFGPDGLLYIGTGDATDQQGAQDLAYLGGKILRIDAGGSPAAGNPFPEAPLVYSYGHRNVQGLAFDSRGRLWASEFGASTYDELNLIEPGGNYGWPIFEGPSDDPKAADPKYVAPYTFWPTSEASPSGLAIVNDTAVMAALRGQRLWLIPLGGAPGPTTPTPFLAGEYGRLRTVVAAPDGSVWLTTSNTDGRGDPAADDDRILRLDIG